MSPHPSIAGHGHPPTTANRIRKTENDTQKSNDVDQPPQLLPPPPIGPLPIDPGAINPSGSSAAAIARSAASSFAFIFKRPPLRFFRPVKISTYGALQVMAEERGKPVSIKFVRSIIKTEGPTRFILNHVLPPFCFNTVIGLTLFTTYTATEKQLSKSNYELHPYLLPALAGGMAGAAQSLISAPLDNLRLLQTIQSDSHHPGHLRFKGWIPLLKKVILPLSHPIHSIPNSTNSERSKLWASRGSSMLGLSILKDSIGFGTFFSLFQIGRDLGKRLANWVDQSIYILSTGCEGQGFNDTQRGWTGRILQSFVIVFSGATAGWAYGIVAEPFERIRRILWHARFDWASINLHIQSNDRQNQSLKKDYHPKSSSSSYAHQDRHRLYDYKEKIRNHHGKTNRKKLPTSIQFNLKGDPGSTTLESNRARLGKIIQNKQKEMLKSTKPPSLFKILDIINLTRRVRNEDRSNRFVSIFKRASKNRLMDSNSAHGMKLNDIQKPFRFFKTSQAKVSSSFKPKLLNNHASRVTGFKSFILSPYSIGFFVWAVCSGDLST